MRISDWSSDVCSSDRCATLLKPHDQTERKGRIGAFFDRFFGRFNDWFGRTTDRYQGGVGKMLAAPLRWLGVFVAMVAVTALLFTRLPGSFLPQEDQGYLVTADRKSTRLNSSH